MKKISIILIIVIAYLFSCTSSKTVTANLDGTKSVAYNGAHIVTWYWKQLNDSIKVTMSGASMPIMPIVYSKPGVYRFELTVTDNKGLSGKDTTTVTVIK